jgi:hypothetical protein
MADSFTKANHNPVPALNSDTSKRVMILPAKAGATVKLSAEGTTDPDGNKVTLRWFLYPEAGTLPAGAKLSTGEGPSTEVSLPANTKGKLHVILAAQDDGTPPLSAYRRAILDIAP